MDKAKQSDNSIDLQSEDTGKGQFSTAKSKCDNDLSGVSDNFDFLSKKITTERSILSNIEQLLTDRDVIIHRSDAINRELIEIIEVRDSSDVTKEIKSQLEELKNETTIKTSLVKEELLKLNNHYESLIEYYYSKMDEINHITCGVKISDILKRRIKEYKKEIGYLKDKILLTEGLSEKLNIAYKDSILRDFNKFLKNIDSKELEKKSRRLKLFFLASAIVSIFVTSICIIKFTSNVPSTTVNEPLAEGLTALTRTPLSILKFIRFIGAGIGFVLILLAGVGFFVSESPEDIEVAKKRCINGVAILMGCFICYGIIQSALG